MVLNNLCAPARPTYVHMPILIISVFLKLINKVKRFVRGILNSEIAERLKCGTAGFKLPERSKLEALSAVATTDLFCLDYVDRITCGFRTYASQILDPRANNLKGLVVESYDVMLLACPHAFASGKH